MNEWYQLNNIGEIDSPALVIYPDRVKKNIDLLISMIDDVSRLRPHVKTHKAKEATLLQIKAGITKFKCATIAEAEMLAICKAPDVLLAYQPVGPKADRFFLLIRNYPETKFSCLVDNLDAAKVIAGSAAENKITVPVFVDLNVGMNRTGIQPGAAAIQLYKDCLKLKGIRLVGLHAYDGHIHDEDLQLRKKRCDEAFAHVDWLKSEIVKAGLDEPVIVAGGSPTFPIHCKKKKG